ncbi:MFS general substrate transporter [Mycena kentingensis (nom. inval.)]|nr:MFS general substrate transporter [Mycena kentingensis (nom. inval.)]
MPSSADSRSADRTRLTALDNAIQATTDTQLLASLRSERSSVENRLATYIYPVQSLPAEIIAEIFQQFVPPYPECAPLVGIESPTTLGQVCSRWRAIAHGTPSLWQGVHLFDSKDYNRRGRFLRAQPAALEAWLRRSCSLPLSIIMGELGESSHEEEREEAVAFLLEHCSRWEYVQLLITDFEGALEGNMPALRQLDISAPSFAFGEIVAPRLRTLMLDTHERDSPEPTLKDLIAALPWSNLQTLVLSGLDAPAAAMILNETRQLVNCWIDIAEEGDWEYVVPATVNLPQTLEALVLLASEFDWEGGAGPAADLIAALSGARDLQRLAIDTFFFGEYGVELIQRNGWRLQHLWSGSPALMGVPGATARSLEQAYAAAFPDVSCIEFVATDGVMTPWPKHETEWSVWGAKSLHITLLNPELPKDFSFSTTSDDSAE